MANGPHYQIGNYIGEITAHGLSKAKTGNNQIVIRVKVLGATAANGSFMEEPFQYERTIFQTITPNTIDRVADILEKLGYTGKGFGPFDPSHPQHQSLVGKEVEIFCNHEQDQQGNMREKWGISTGSGGKALELTPLNPKELRELDSLFGKNLRATTSTPAPAPARSAATRTATAPDPSEISDDDIPF